MMQATSLVSTGNKMRLKPLGNSDKHPHTCVSHDCLHYKKPYDFLLNCQHLPYEYFI